MRPFLEALFGLLWIVVLVMAALSIIAFSLLTQRNIGSGGSIEAYNLMVYEDSELAVEATFVAWNTVYPESQSNQTLYIVANSPVTLNMTSSNWQPVNITDVLSLSWDSEGYPLAREEVKAVVLTLTVGNATVDIAFTLDITFTGS